MHAKSKAARRESQPRLPSHNAVHSTITCKRVYAENGFTLLGVLERLCLSLTRSANALQYAAKDWDEMRYAFRRQIGNKLGG